MAKEIEYKFLVKEMPDLRDPEHGDIKGRNIFQGYLTPSGNDVAVRVRMFEICDTVRPSFITVKCGRHDEYEYEIPAADAEEMLRHCDDRIISKTRYMIDHEDYTIELDVFHGKLSGLVMAEIEVESEDFVLKNLPDWLGENVTGNYHYSNVYLAEHGYNP